MTSAAYGSERPDQAWDVRLVDTIPTLAWAARADGSADFFNQRWLDYTGLSAEQARDWGWTVALHPNELNGLVDYRLSVLASGRPGEMEARLRRVDGVYRWLQSRALALRDVAGRVTGWYVFLTDIDDRKRAERELKKAFDEKAKSEAELRTILDAIPQLIVAMDTD
jgi:PAS domain S-box-containing protein